MVPGRTWPLEAAATGAWSLWVGSKNKIDIYIEGAKLQNDGGGSRNNNQDFLGSVIQTLDGVFYEYLPSLPVATDNFCLTIIDNERLFVAGGATAEGRTASAYLFSTDTNEWTRVDDMPGGQRDQSGCGVARYVDGSLKVTRKDCSVPTGVEGDGWFTEQWGWQKWVQATNETQHWYGVHDEHGVHHEVGVYNGLKSQSKVKYSRATRADD